MPQRVDPIRVIGKMAPRIAHEIPKIAMTEVALGATPAWQTPTSYPDAN